ncbi:hypothetical protein Taro_005033 [Colocasia esculenta]|uniref:Uncharacterized protein n=1 Tax=Colocasia esculenta TaxID=4460 RepID=A0A843TRV0_COLES|nr:hypothetical protein [Colocasia esculenta]
MCFVLGGPLVSTLLEVVSTHYPKTAQMMFWVLITSMAAKRAQARDMQRTIQNLTQAILQATQGGGNRGAGELHRNFRNMDPPRFEGSTNPNVAKHWVKEIEMIFKVMQCTD